MALSPAQYAALKAHILANTAVVGGVQIKDTPNTGDGNFTVAAWYNLDAAPAFTVWKRSVAIVDVFNSINGAELGGLTTANHTRLQTLALGFQAGVNPSRADTRQFFDDIFSGAGGVNTRAALLVLWKELASSAEKLFSTGTGSDAAPATCAAGIGQNFQLAPADVNTALNLP